MDSNKSIFALKLKKFIFKKIKLNFFKNHFDKSMVIIKRTANIKTPNSNKFKEIKI